MSGLSLTCLLGHMWLINCIILCQVEVRKIISSSRSLLTTTSAIAHISSHRQEALRLLRISSSLILTQPVEIIFIYFLLKNDVIHLALRLIEWVQVITETDFVCVSLTHWSHLCCYHGNSLKVCDLVLHLFQLLFQLGIFLVFLREISLEWDNCFVLIFPYTFNLCFLLLDLFLKLQFIFFKDSDPFIKFHQLIFMILDLILVLVCLICHDKLHLLLSFLLLLYIFSS